MLQLSNIHKSFSGVPVLKGASLEVGAAEIVGLIGASGAGKSVLARIIVGLDKPDTGRIKIDRLAIDIECPSDQPVDWPQVRRLIGYIPQARGAPTYRTVLEFVTEGPRYVLSKSNASATAIAEGLLSEFKVAEHRRKYLTEVSGGQLARICLARALAVNPEILVCDEIFSNLDPVAASDVAESLLKAKARGIGLLVISHQLSFLANHASCVHFLHGGLIEESGNPKMLFSEPKTAATKKFLQLNHSVA